MLLYPQEFSYREYITIANMFLFTFVLTYVCASPTHPTHTHN